MTNLFQRKKANHQGIQEFDESAKPEKKGKGRVKQFFAKLSRGLMLPIAVLPIAGLLLGIGGALGANLPDNATADVFAKIFKGMSDIVFSSLPLLFAIAITITFSKDKGASGFCAALGYLVFCSCQNAFFQYDSTGHLTSIFWFHKPLTELMGTSLGIPVLQTSIFGGILVGALTSLIYNKISKVKLPSALEFFSGVRLVPFVLIPSMFLLSVVICLFWPWVGQGILFLGEQIQSAPYGTDGLLYGILGRALMPFGLHHIPIVLAFQTPFGGSLSKVALENGLAQVGILNTDPIYINIISQFDTFAKGNATIDGDQQIWNFINGLPYNTLPTATGGKEQIFEWFKTYTGVYAGRFTQDYPTYLGLCIGIGAAIIVTAEKQNRKQVASVIGAAMFVAFLTGITEPLEFTFLFCAPWLYYLAYVPLSGFSYMFMELLHAHVGVGFARGFVDLMIYGAIPVLKGTNFWWAFVLAVAEGLFIFGIFWICIKKFDLPTPGRKDNPMTLMSKKEYNELKSSEPGQTNVQGKDRIMAIINLLGGRENIEDVAACATRLRVSVKSNKNINGDAFTPLGSKGAIIKDGGLQLIFGGEASIIADEINEILDSGVEIKKVDIPTSKETKSDKHIESKQAQPITTSNNTSISKTKKTWLSEKRNVIHDIYSPCTGTVNTIESLKDEVFSKKMVGDGIVIDCKDGIVRAPMTGKVVLATPFKHAYGIMNGTGAAVLIHIGVDTVKLEGYGLKSFVQKDQIVQKGDIIAKFDYNYIKKKGLDHRVIVLITGDSKFPIARKTDKQKVTNSDVVLELE